jgi:nucleoside-diphosphate-sugar epimerase
MNIFLSGASGYIGRRVAEKLQAAGHQILGLARSDHAVQWMQDQGITPHRGDLFDGPSLTQAALLVDGVIHLGAAVGPAWAEGDRIAVHALLDALAGSGKPFVYTSGTPIYGDTSLTVVDDLADLYVLAFERASAGSVLNAAAGTSVSMKELAMAISFAIGRERSVASWTLEQARAALGPRADFFAMNQHVSGAKATLLLEWNPQAPSLLYDVAYGSYRIAKSRTSAE